MAGDKDNDEPSVSSADVEEGGNVGGSGGGGLFLANAATPRGNDEDYDDDDDNNNNNRRVMMGGESESSAASSSRLSMSLSATSSSRGDGGRTPTDGSTTTSGKSGGGSVGRAIRPTIAREETRTVRTFRIVLIVALVASAAGVAVAVYLYTTSNETAQFKAAFEVNSVKVLEGIGRGMERTLASLDDFQAGLVAEARATNQSWPFVVISKFGVRAAKTRRMGEGLYVAVHPRVERHQRGEWERFALQHEGWLNESMKIQERDELYYGPVWYNHSVLPYVHDSHYHETPGDRDVVFPSWYSSPLVSRYPAYNMDLLSAHENGAIVRSLEARLPVLGEAYNLVEEHHEVEIHEDWYHDFLQPGQDPEEPICYLHYPLIDWDMDSLTLGNYTIEARGLEGEPTLVGMMRLLLFWRSIVEDLLAEGANGIDVVFHNPCTPSFTYRIMGRDAVYRGGGDYHEVSYDDMAINESLLDLQKYFIRTSKYSGLPLDDKYCPYTLSVYPSGKMQASYTTTNPVYFTVATVLIFGFTSLLFIVYDKSVEARQRKVMNTAVRAETIVQSLYPAVVRDRLFQTENVASNAKGKKIGVALNNSKTEIKSFLASSLDGGSTQLTDDTDGASGTGILYSTPPIAELYPESTVLFADIVGFTAWCSQRSPSQVFTLLETLYGSFDSIARRRGVFKVETIGDSYVAVAGLPEPRPDHAVVMARFARDCRAKMASLVSKLERTMGPDTGELKLRFGLNSGPVTAGVLRGDRSRFQLFGDTVNCAARMESNGKPGMIQVSQKTADLLIAAGKDSWLKKREDLVEAKGKGALQTYWVDPAGRAGSDSRSEVSSSDISHFQDSCVSWQYNMDADMLERLIEWNLESFTTLLKGVVAWRAATGGAFKHSKLDEAAVSSMMGINPRAEISEVVILPENTLDLKSSHAAAPVEVELGTEVTWQLRDYISSIAYMYRDNPFHNFEHASHVVSATLKLLSRVLSPDISVEGAGTKSHKKVLEGLVSSLHSSTYGITSDPLTQFAIVFAALVHDVDHRGVSNGQLANERDPLAVRYGNESVAEQNSVAVAWELLLRPCYSDLRAALFGSHGDVARFRQLVVNSVMATDIFDATLKSMRESRWSKAFDGKAPGNRQSSEDVNRMATIVIEHLIQAGDVSHTMQHWHVYRKWNARLFQEMHTAYVAGRAPSNPADGWYKGELWFFDNYIIPLAEKLRECKVFGASCDELLNYALDNRNEWQAKGEQIVAELVEHSASATAGRRAMAAATKPLLSVGSDDPPPLLSVGADGPSLPPPPPTGQSGEGLSSTSIAEPTPEESSVANRVKQERLFI